MVMVVITEQDLDMVLDIALYNDRYGNGSGTGYHSGNGRCIYPSELIQYWK